MSGADESDDLITVRQGSIALHRHGGAVCRLFSNAVANHHPTTQPRCGPNLQVRVLLFAKAREVFGAKETEVRVRAQSSPQHILETLQVRPCPPRSMHQPMCGLTCPPQPLAQQESCPQMADIAASLMVSHNQEYVDMDSSLTLRNRDEIGIIPPLSGG